MSTAAAVMLFRRATATRASSCLTVIGMCQAREDQQDWIIISISEFNQIIDLIYPACA
jgi:hypothetical protein